MNRAPCSFRIGQAAAGSQHPNAYTRAQDGSIFKIQYGSGPVQGYFSEDQVELAGLTVEGQVCVGADDV